LVASPARAAAATREDETTDFTDIKEEASFKVAPCAAPRDRDVKHLLLSVLSVKSVVLSLSFRESSPTAKICNVSATGLSTEALVR
jgi:hypothetical protein